MLRLMVTDFADRGSESHAGTDGGGFEALRLW
jgi:hypothetical protein